MVDDESPIVVVSPEGPSVRLVVLVMEPAELEDVVPTVVLVALD